jgi:hypothetical protein
MDYPPTLEEYMAGKWEPPPPAPLKRLKHERHYYGVGPGPQHSLFYVVSAEKIPAGAAVVEEGTESSDAVMPRLRAMRTELRSPVRKAPSQPKAPAEVEPGRVAWHEDDRGSHLTIILDVRGNDCTAVFLTSNERWARRPATSDELALVGFAASRRTYLAPVTRKKWEFAPKHVALPQHRLEQLRAEFLQAA